MRSSLNKQLRVVLALVRGLFGDRQTVELVGTIAAYNMVARFLVALGVDEKGE